MIRGERIANKTRSAIKEALLVLIKQKNYPDITVGEIAEQGNIGRSTLYKHYSSKAAVLVDIHKDIFEKLFSSLSTPAAWVASDPPEELVLFFEELRKLGKNPFLLSYKLGNDLDFLISNITLELARVIEEKLKMAFDEKKSTIPVPILAQAVSDVYSGLVMAWFLRNQSADARVFATYMQRLTRAQVCEAIPGAGKLQV